MPLGCFSCFTQSHRDTEAHRGMQNFLILPSVFLRVSVALCETRAMPSPPERPPLRPSGASRGIRVGALHPLGNVSIISHRATETQRRTEEYKNFLILSSVFLRVSVALCETRAMPHPSSAPRSAPRVFPEAQGRVRSCPSGVSRGASHLLPLTFYLSPSPRGRGGGGGAPIGGSPLSGARAWATRSASRLGPPRRGRRGLW